jgi:hypothetical protein
MSTCPQCQTELMDEARFCQKCGTAITAAAVAPEARLPEPVVPVAPAAPADARPLFVRNSRMIAIAGLLLCRHSHPVAPRP